MRRLVLLFLAVSLVGCVRAASHNTSHAGNQERAGWHGDNWERLQAALTQRVPVGDAAPRRVAVFDWDNTMMRNDIGDATLFWMLRHDQVLQPAGRDWRARHPLLSPEAASALQRACDGAGEPDTPLATSRTPRCADELLSIYLDNRSTDGAAAWTTPDTPTMHPPYAFGAELLAGHTPDAARGFARAAFREASDNPLGTEWTVGSRRVTGWVRLYDEMHNLLDHVRQAGLDAWIVSASAQPLVEVVAAHVGVPPDHVIGVRMRVDGNGKLTATPEPCGAGTEPVITYDEGKRCWINKVIFKAAPEHQLAPATSDDQRPFLVAGDSDTDLAMLKDATGARLVINRQRTRLMCHAYGDGDPRWIVQPMFIDPLPPRATPYPCSTSRDARGMPLTTPAGQPIPDQPDRVAAR
ncbi:MAG: haloacid dehalogenase-like hydrolase [Myxococcota bacterium]